MDLPAQTEIIETVSFCGNTSGTGNHVEIWVGVLIRSELSDKEIVRFFQDYHTVWAFPSAEDLNMWAQEIHMSSYYNKFLYLRNNGDRVNCYIIADYYDAVTQNDIRGH